MIIASITLKSGIELNNAKLLIETVHLNSNVATAKYNIYADESREPAQSCYVQFEYMYGNIIEEAEEAVLNLLTS
jgi:hypothetical protein